MSEVSESLHVRTDDAEGCIAGLRRFGFNGVVFRGARGWLSVVPYGGPEGLVHHLGRMGQLAAALGQPILAYGCNDFGWIFLLWLPDGRSTGFQAATPDVFDIDITPETRELAAELGEKLGLPDHDALDEAVLAAVVAPEKVRPLLNPVLDGSVSPDEPAYAFAEALGLAEFAWLSPAYVTDDLDEARRRGGEEIGRRPDG